MEKLGNSSKRHTYDYEQMFMNNIDDQEVISFLKVNNLSFEEAMKYFSEFKIYVDNKNEYELSVDDKAVVLLKKEKTINPGLNFLDVEHFKDHKTIDNTDYKTNPSKATIVEQFVRNPNQGWFLCADNGVGKTTLATALANSFYKQSNQKTLFVFWPDFIEKTKRFSDKNYLFINKVKHAPRLIIDDLGNESISSWSRDDVLHAIIEKMTTLAPFNYITGENFRKNSNEMN